ncbi:MAG: hypothetical protein WBW62_01835 [Solirubrobacterales bacterium]
MEVLDSVDLGEPVDITYVIETSATIGGFVLLFLLMVSAVNLAVRRGRTGSWRGHYPHPVRYLVVRVGIAAAVGASFFVLIAAGLVLNSNRPPEDATPVVTVENAAGPASLRLSMEDCGQSIEGSISVSGGGTSATVYSDQNGLQDIPLDADGKGSFELDQATAKRGLLSCYLQLPVVKAGENPSSVKLSLNSYSEIDTVASIPPPDAFSNGRWTWNCEAGMRCPTLATVGYAIEDGTKQVIVLILAAIFGSIIALFMGEALIEPVRRKLRGPDQDD